MEKGMMFKEYKSTGEKNNFDVKNKPNKEWYPSIMVNGEDFPRLSMMEVGSEDEIMVKIKKIGSETEDNGNGKPKERMRLEICKIAEAEGMPEKTRKFRIMKMMG